MVDALVSGASVERRAGSSPVLGTDQTSFDLLNKEWRDGGNRADMLAFMVEEENVLFGNAIINVGNTFIEEFGNAVVSDETVFAAFNPCGFIFDAFFIVYD